MKCVLEFGRKGGACVENTIIPTLKLGSRLTQDLIWVLSDRLTFMKLKVSRKEPRQTWENSTHFVALSIMDDVPRGPASAQLWRK